MGYRWLQHHTWVSEMIDRAAALHTVIVMRRWHFLLVLFTALLISGSLLHLYDNSLSQGGAGDTLASGVVDSERKVPPTFPGTSEKDGIHYNVISEVRRYLQSSSIPTWLRESWFYNYSHYLREGETPDMSRKDSLNVDIGSPFKVLVIGDSLVRGTGLSDMETRWTNRLERELNKATAQGAFRVDSLALGNASAIEEPEWLTEERVKKYDPDLLVIAYFRNDPVPSYREQIICGTVRNCAATTVENIPGYTNCVNGRAGAFPILIRHVVKPLFPNVAYELLRKTCDARKLVAKSGFPDHAMMESSPRTSPYWPAMQESVRSIPARVGTIPIVLAPAHTTSSSVALVEEVADLYTSIGATIAPMRRTLKLTGSSTLYDNPLWSNPVDQHPGPIFTQAMAEDVSEHILGVIGPDTARKIKARAFSLQYPYISNFLPNELKLRQTESVSEIVYDGGSGTSVPAYTHLGVDLALQRVPCAVIGRPHAQVVLEPTRDLSRQLRLRAAVTPPQGLVIYAFSHPVEYSNGMSWGPDVRALGTLKPGDTIPIPTQFSSGRTLDGLLVGEVGNEGCGTDRTVTMSSFHLYVDQA